MRIREDKEEEVEVEVEVLLFSEPLLTNCMLLLLFLSAGADIKEMTSKTFAGLVTGKFRSNFAALQSTKPLIAAVNGYAVSKV